jgi:hypothetical protein
VVELLHNKCETQSSKPTKTRRRKRERERMTRGKEYVNISPKKMHK